MVSNCSNKIEQYKILSHPSTTIKSNIVYFKPMVLNCAKYILISKSCANNCGFQMIWSNKCKSLRLFQLFEINQQWCTNIIDNCDCTRVKILDLCWVTFSTNINSNILQSLAEKFENLKILKIFYFRHNGWEDDRFQHPHKKVPKQILLFWKYLHPICVKNNTQIYLTIWKDIKSVEFLKLINFLHDITSVNNTPVKINTIDFNMDLVVPKHFSSLQQLIGNTDIKQVIVRVSHMKQSGFTNKLLLINENIQQNVILKIMSRGKQIMRDTI